MYEKKYGAVGQKLKAHQRDLSQRLWGAIDVCWNIEPNQARLSRLVDLLVEAFFAFLHHWEHHTPMHLGEELNQIRATPMFLAYTNKAMRDFCLAHLSDELLIAGLEATADFFGLIVQAYVQSNQGVLKLQTIKRKEQSRIKAVLAKRDLTVLRLLAQGKTNKQIAEVMGVTERTVVNYLQRVRSKLGTQRRTETIAAAMRLLDL